MKTETPFDPAGELIVVNATLWGPRGSVHARMVIDTGAAATVVVPDLLDEIGYSPRDGVVRTTVHTAIGEEHSYIQKLTQFDALGFTRTAFPIQVFELSNRYGIDGLIGLNFLDKFNYEIRSAEGRILVENIEP